MNPPVPAMLCRPTLTRRRERGVMLIEVLVSLLIFAFGVLGLVGLQASMAQAQTASRARSDAASLAGELIGLMWANLPNIASYDTAQCVENTDCADWTSKVKAELPGAATPVVTVTTVSAPGITPVVSTVTVTLKWTPPGGGGQHVYTTQATLSGP